MCLSNRAQHNSEPTKTSQPTSRMRCGKWTTQGRWGISCVNYNIFGHEYRTPLTHTRGRIFSEWSEIDQSPILIQNTDQGNGLAANGARHKYNCIIRDEWGSSSGGGSGDGLDPILLLTVATDELSDDLSSVAGVRRLVVVLCWES